MIEVIRGKKDFIESLRGKKATFMLALSTTKTIEIEGITQAGIPGFIHLTPTLDAEFVCVGDVRSIPNLAQTPKGVPTPALLTRATHLLHPFGNIELLDLGMDTKAKVDYFVEHSFNIKPSSKIDTGADINAMELFEKGVEFGKEYVCKDDYILLAESVPSGTTTAEATALALGYSVEGYFSSSFKDAPNDVKKQTISSALKRVEGKSDLFDIVGSVSDNMLIFNAGFILGSAYSKTPIVLCGGTQMASLLLLVNSVVNYMGGELDSKNIALCTTKWVAKDENSNIEALLEMLDFPINAYYADFDFSSSTHPALKLYDDGEAKEGVGAGGALVYGLLNGLSKEDIVKQVELFLS
jgi:uncharacterized protein (TIGR00303 family)